MGIAKSPTSLKPSPGYSLPEALIVVGILAAILLSAVPNGVELFHRYTLWVATYELLNEAQKARMTAVADNTSIGLRGGQEGGTYQLVDAKGVPVAAPHYLPSGIRFESLPRTDIRFHPRGTAAPAGTLALTGPAGRARVIVSLSGRVRMEMSRLGPE